MIKRLICAHPWRLIQAKQTLWSMEGDRVMAAIYRCPVCQAGKAEGDVDPRVVLGILEEES